MPGVSYVNVAFRPLNYAETYGQCEILIFNDVCAFPRWWQLPYYWAGIKMYDLVAGIQNLKSSYVLSKASALERFPMLNKDKLVGAIVYYDGG